MGHPTAMRIAPATVASAPQTVRHFGEPSRNRLFLPPFPPNLLLIARFDPWKTGNRNYL
jgi:hypothetical protein